MLAISGEIMKIFIKLLQAGQTMQKYTIISVILAIICTLLVAIGQIAMKVGVGKMTFNILTAFNYPLIIGLVLYGAGSLFLMFSLKYGNLSLVHPLMSLGFVWASIFAYMYLNEQFTAIKIIGITFVLFGTTFIMKGDK